jgi:VanZ family protein
MESVRLVDPRRRPSSAWRWLLLILPALGSLFFAVNPLDLPRWLRPLLDLSHVPIFALASALLVRWVPALARLSVRQQLLAALAGSLLIGGGIEIIQPWFGRNGDVGDAISDMTGAAAGVLFCSRRRREFTWHWRRALQLSILAVVLLAGHRAAGWYLASSEAFARFPLVADFEAPYAARLWSSGTRTDAIARSGLHALHVTFDSSGWAATTHEPPVADWSGFRTLQMAVFNPVQEAQPFSVLIADRSVPDRSGNRRPWFRQRTELQPGWNQIEVAMEDVAAGGVRGPVDITRIGFLTLEIPQPTGVVDLFIDDVLLVPAPAGETDVAGETATAEQVPR